MVKLKRLFTLFLAFLLAGLILVPTPVYAKSTSVRNVVIYVSLNEDGSADITETWDVSVTGCTEWYLVQGNLGDIEIQDFSVEEDGNVFENEGAWDVDRSIDEKAGKCGIVNKGNGNYELCWGVGRDGAHVFMVHYRMTNFVKGFDDYCAFNQRVINDGLSSAPKEIHVMVTKPGTEFTSDDVKVWAFGYEGTIYVKEGVVEADSTKALTSDDYVTVMCRFPRDMFDTTCIRSGSFEDMKKTAFEGSDYQIDHNDSGTDATSHHKKRSTSHPLSIFQYLALLKYAIALLVMMVLIIRLRKRTKAKQGRITTFEEARNSIQEDKNYTVWRNPLFWVITVLLLILSPIIAIFFLVYVLLTNGKEKIKVSSNLSGNAYPIPCIRNELRGYEEYFRDIPLEGNIPAFYALGTMISVDSTSNNIIGAYLLKWLQEERIEIRKERKAGLGGMLGLETPSVILKRAPFDVDFALERQLFEMLRAASGGDDILQEKEMYRWSSNNYDKVNKLMELFEKYGKTYMKEREYLGEIPVDRLGGILKASQDAFTESGREQVLAWRGLRNFLKDFTIINERPPEDIVLWDDYLIAAQMFGMADKVAEKFKEIYPDYFESRMGYYDGLASSYVLIDTISRASTNGARAGSSSSSSGGGGSSSSGGGGGSSGGGSGGGGR